MTEETQIIEEAPTKTISPEFIMTIVNILNQNEAEEAEVKTKEEQSQLIYLLVKSILYNDDLRPTVGNITDVIFATYIEVYSAYYASNNRGALDETELKNEAALSFFDIYLLDTKDSLIKKLVVKSSESIQMVVTEVESRTHPSITKSLMAGLSNLALITNCLDAYMKPSNRNHNLKYIEWVKTFLKDVLRTKSIEISIDSYQKEISKIIPQLVNNADIVTL